MALGYMGKNKTVRLTSEPQIIADYNLHRHGLYIFNDAGATCQIAIGFDPKPTDYFQLGAGNKLELDTLVPAGPVWATGSGPLHMIDNAMIDSVVGWSPAELLPAVPDKKAIWFDLSDTSTVFSDIAGTVPATEGDLVRFIKDKSGNGYDAIYQSGRVPTWTKGSLEFAEPARFRVGGDVNPDFQWNLKKGGSYGVFGVTPYEANTPSNRRYLYCFGGNYASSTGASVAFDKQKYGNSTRPHWRFSINGATTWTPVPNPPIHYDVPVVIGTTFQSQGDGVTGVATLYRNKKFMESAIGSANSPGGGQPYSLFHDSELSSGFIGKVHYFFIQATDVYDTDGFLKLERWVANGLNIEV